MAVASASGMVCRACMKVTPTVPSMTPRHSTVRRCAAGKRQRVPRRCMSTTAISNTVP